MRVHIRLRAAIKMIPPGQTALKAMADPSMQAGAMSGKHKEVAAADNATATR